MLKAKIDDKSQNVIIRLQCSKEEWKEAQSQAKGDISKTLKVPGFRVGSKIPDHILEKHLDRSKLFNKAIEKMMKKHSEIVDQEAEKTAKKNSKKFFSQPFVDVVKLSDSELEIDFSYPYLPNLKDLKLDGIKTKFIVKKYTEKLVDDEINNFLIKLSVEESTKEPAKKTDHVIIDFKGFIDDVPFEGGEAEKYELVLGSNQFIPGFEDQLIGKKAGWKGSINVTFPSNYFVKQYRDKVCTFEIFIHEVKRHNIPELDLTMIPMFGIPNITTVSELREKMTIITKTKLLDEAKLEFKNSLVSEIIKLNNFSVNDRLLEEKVKKFNNQFNEQLKENKIKRSEYFELTKTNEQDVMDQFKENARIELARELVFSHLIERDAYTPSKEEIEFIYKSFAQQYNYTIEQIKSFTKEDEIKFKIKDEHLTENLIMEFDNENFKVYKKLTDEISKMNTVKNEEKSKTKPSKTKEKTSSKTEKTEKKTKTVQKEKPAKTKNPTTSKKIKTTK